MSEMLKILGQFETQIFIYAKNRPTSVFPHFKNGKQQVKAENNKIFLIDVINEKCAVVCDWIKIT